MTSGAQKKQPFKWQPNSKILLFALLLLPLLLGLGYWQLQRADEKQQILDQYNANRQLPPVSTVAELATVADLQYRPAWIAGAVDNQRTIILDNRVKYGRPGYEILQAVEIAGADKKLLINRGWVPASLDRSVLPTIPEIEAEVQLRGFLYRTLRGGYQLDDGVGRVLDWPSRVGWVTVERSEELFGEPFFAYQLRLNSDSAGALETGWVTVSVQPHKHTAYAVQWFAMALTLLILTIIANSNLISYLKKQPSNNLSG